MRAQYTVAIPVLVFEGDAQPHDRAVSNRHATFLLWAESPSEAAQAVIGALRGIMSEQVGREAARLFLERERR